MINFALLGTGRIGKLHASIINDHPEASLKYVYDIDTSSAKKIAKKYGTPFYSYSYLYFHILFEFLS